MGGRQQRIHDAHLATRGQQLVDDVGADEPGAAGDEDWTGHEGGTVGTRNRTVW